MTAALDMAMASLSTMAACSGSSSFVEPAKVDDGSCQFSLRLRQLLQHTQPKETQPRDPMQAQDTEVEDEEGKSESQEDETEENDCLDDLFICTAQKSTSGRCCRSQNLRPLDLRLESQQAQAQPQSSPSDHRRPTASRASMIQCHRQGGRCRSPPSSKQQRRSSEDPSSSQSDNGLCSVSMTWEEFAALPPTIQRKYFSTLERLRFAQSTRCATKSSTASDTRQDSSDPSQPSNSSREEDTIRPRLRARLSFDALTSTPSPQRQFCSNSTSLCTVPADKLKSQSVDSGACFYQSVILDATDEALVKIGKRRSQFPRLESSSCEPNYTFYTQPAMNSLVEDFTFSAEGLKTAEDPLHDCLRWLEEDDHLDLRLGFDTMQNKDCDNGPKKSRLLSRRHLSVSRLPRMPYYSVGYESTSRSDAKDATASPTPTMSNAASIPSPQGRFRRRSRTMSLITPTSQMVTPEPSPAVDSAASHYQDPEARMKLRVYLASPHKFDEAIEFGFPSISDVQGKDETWHTLSSSQQPIPDYETVQPLSDVDDEIASLCSDPASPTELESPRTPESMARPLLGCTAHIVQDSMTLPKMDYAHAPASCREMTLRMTLTRPDLRADEEQIYGWQKSCRKLHVRDDSAQPRVYARDASSMSNFEKQWADIDHEVVAGDMCLVKRLWNRVRRS